MKLFKTKKIAEQAVRRQGLHLMQYEVKYMDARDSGYYVEFTVEETEDLHELRERGFKSVLKK